MVQGKGDTQKFKHKHEIKYKCCNKEHEFKFVPSSKDYTAEWEYEPSQLNKDGVHASVSLEGSCAPLAHEYKGKAEFKLGGFKVGPLSPWTELQYDRNTTGSSTENLMTASQNVVYQDYHVAWKAVADLDQKKLTEAYGVLALKNEKGDFYLRSNCLNRLVGLGSFFSLNDNAHHAYEVQYDFYGKNKGMFDLPLFFRFGGHYHLQNGAKLSTRLFLSNKWMFTNNFEVPIGKQIKVTVSDQADLWAAFKDPKNLGYKLGFALEFKL